MRTNDYLNRKLSAVLMLLFAFLFYQQTKAQDFMNVIRTDASNNYSAISDISKITFDGSGGMVINKTGGGSSTETISAINKLTFDEGLNHTLTITIMLEGAFDTDSMTTTLGTSIPLVDPYTGSESVTEMPANVVDWVKVELRSLLDNTIVVGSKAALLLNTGAVVSTDGSSPVTVSVSPDGGAYYLVVKHRNHLSVMSKYPLNN